MWVWSPRHLRSVAQSITKEETWSEVFLYDSLSLPMRTIAGEEGDPEGIVCVGNMVFLVRRAAHTKQTEKPDGSASRHTWRNGSWHLCFLSVMAE
jgi:hypothetical protein